MTSVMVRGFSEDLHRRAKAVAALQGKTLQAFVLEAIAAAVKQAKKGGK